jgi:BirA family transcriptional regulator, biotin operon repressor / biotin---[acetyl-CoA-carboxylase] ligase
LSGNFAATSVVRLEEVGSTLDAAHQLAAAGADAGTLIVADVQTAGRGRMGRSWRSERDAGIWLTLIERPRDPSGLEVLSLRVGLALAPALDAFAAAPVRLKWPNDLYVRERKLGGILIEARWREQSLEWLAIGVGINLRPPASEPNAIGLEESASRDAVLAEIVPAIRGAAARSGLLDRAELAAFAARDIAVGRRCLEPVSGIVRGISPSGALRVEVALSGGNGSTLTEVRAGSLVLESGEGGGSDK